MAHKGFFFLALYIKPNLYVYVLTENYNMAWNEIPLACLSAVMCMNFSLDQAGKLVSVFREIRSSICSSLCATDILIAMILNLYSKLKLHYVYCI